MTIASETTSLVLYNVERPLFLHQIIYEISAIFTNKIRESRYWSLFSLFIIKISLR